MELSEKDQITETTEQHNVRLRYAAVLQRHVAVALVLLVASFLLYVFGILPSDTPPSRVAELWHLDASKMAGETGHQGGWWWTTCITSGDAVSFAAISFIALGTIVGLVLVLPTFLRHRDLHYAGIVSLQIVVLFLAASGLFSVG